MRPIVLFAFLFLTISLHAADDAEQPDAGAPPTMTAEESARLLAEIKAEKAKRAAEKAAAGGDPVKPAADPELAARRADDAAKAKTAELLRELESAQARYRASGLKAVRAAEKFVADTEKVKSFSVSLAITEVCRAQGASNGNVLFLVADARRCAANIRRIKAELGVKVAVTENDDAVITYCQKVARDADYAAEREKVKADAANPNAHR